MLPDFECIDADELTDGKLMPATLAFDSGTETTRLAPSNDEDDDADVASDVDDVDDIAYDV